MSWKITLGKPSEIYIIGKRWLKKKIPKSKRFSKTLHKEEDCPGAIYDIGMHYLPDSPNERKNIWVCMETGKIFTSAPKLIPRQESVSTKPKKVIKPKITTPIIKHEPKPIPEKVTPIVESKPIPEKVTPIIKSKSIPESKPKPIKPISPKFTKETSISEVKGIGKAAYDTLTAVEINTIGDLLSIHSQEIATKIGRKSDSQIKKWQETAKTMIE